MFDLYINRIRKWRNKEWLHVQDIAGAPELKPLFECVQRLSLSAVVYVNGVINVVSSMIINYIHPQPFSIVLRLRHD